MTTYRYFTKRVSTNGTEYRFDYEKDTDTVIRITRVSDHWYQSNETILYRTFANATDALEFFESLLRQFPNHPLYK